MNDGDDLDPIRHNPIDQSVGAFENLAKPLSFIAEHNRPDSRLRRQGVTTVEETLDHAQSVLG